MRPAWHLATNSLSARRSRTALLIASVALSAALIVAVACAMASLNRGIRDRIQETVGLADLRVVHVGNRDLGLDLVESIRSWPESAFVVGRSEAPVRLLSSGEGVTTTAYGIDQEREYELRPLRLLRGTVTLGEDEVVIDEKAAEDLGVDLGDPLEVDYFGDPLVLQVVGVVERSSLGMLGPGQSFMTMETLWKIDGRPSRVREIDIVLDEGERPGEVAEARRPEMERGVLLRISAKVSSELDKNLQSSQIGLVISSVLAFLSAAFIIMTGLTTNVTERQRELAVLRCVGAYRSQLGWAQLFVGLIMGGAGAVLGAPLGVVGAFGLISLFKEQLPGGFAMSWLGVVLAVVGSLGAGFLGAAWPAFQASRTSPLQALSVRARVTGNKSVLVALVVGLAGALVHVALLSLPLDSSLVFWLDITVGMPAMFLGYFLLAVPVTVLVVKVGEPVIAKVLRLPSGLLGRTVSATPYRHGFTAGAMMVGLAMLVAIWTNGQAIMRDWLQSLEFPDGFVNALNMTEETQARIDAVEGIDATCAITLQTMETDVFNVDGVASYKTTFIAFEPDRFFAMTELTFLQGDEETARRRLSEGDAILVAREFTVAKGIGVGDTLVLRHEGVPREFEIVGVVTSPGLDIAYKFFNIGKEYLQQSVNAVFGSREVLKESFGNDGIDLLQLDFSDDVTDEVVLSRVKQAARESRAAIMTIGSGRAMKDEIKLFLGGTLMIFSVVAVASMLVACFGVANLIVASVQARTYEFGVLRAIGAQRGLLARLVLAEALIIAITACILGTLMGTQSAWAGTAPV